MYRDIIALGRLIVASCTGVIGIIIGKRDGGNGGFGIAPWDDSQGEAVTEH